MDALKKVGDQFALPIYLLDNSFKTVLVPPQAVVGDVVTDFTHRLGLREPAKLVPNCCLCECRDGVTLSRPLRMGARVSEIMEQWKRDVPAKFVFRVKLFTATLTKSTDKAATHLLYIDAVYSTIAGLYPVAAEEAVSLGALQMQAKYGSHKAGVHTPGFLGAALRGMIPAPLLPSRPALDWERDILQRHALLNEDAQGRPTVLYCAVLAVRDWYGCALFTTKQTFSKLLPTVVSVAISGSGVFILDKASKATLEKFYIHQLYRWGYIPEKEDGTGCKGFYFQTKLANAALGPTLEFTTTQGEAMSSLLTDYAQRMLEEILEAQAAEKARAKAAEAGGGGGAPSPSSKVAVVASAVRAAGGGAPAPAALSTAPKAQPLPAVKAPVPPPGLKRSAAENASLAEGQAAARVATLFQGRVVHTEQARTWAAVQIQTVTRGYLGRQKFDRLLDALEADLRAKGKI